MDVMTHEWPQSVKIMFWNLKAIRQASQRNTVASYSITYKVISYTACLPKRHIWSWRWSCTAPNFQDYSQPTSLLYQNSHSYIHQFSQTCKTNCNVKPHFFQKKCRYKKREDGCWIHELAVVIEKFHKLSLNFYINFYHNNRFTFHMNKFIKTRKKKFFSYIYSCLLYVSCDRESFSGK
jgi:hypothetical protein